jgi:general secretion pathway protein A
MYQSFYSLNSKPFQITTDPKFLWLGEKHKEALATLKYGILENKGFLLLTGDIGTGKTALINALVKIIDVAAIVATIPDPGLDSLDFFNILAEEFKMNKHFDSKGAFLIQLKHFLHKAFAADKKVLLIVDEAQRLNHDLLEQIRLLSNIEMNNRKLINIFFVGQTEFSNMLREERSKAIRQRISVTFHIEPLTENETWHYIRHRLKIAGTNQEIFHLKAVQEIYSFSQGYPRLINIICDHALLTGYASGVKMIDANVIKECEKELHIPIDTKKREAYQEPSLNKKAMSVATETREQPPGKRSILWILLLILFISGGYLLYYLNLEEAPSFRMEDIAPQKYDSPALREKESFVPGVTDRKEKSQPQPAVKPVTGSTAETEKVPDTVTSDSAQDSGRDTAAQKSEDTRPAPDQKTLIYFNHNSNDLPDEVFETLDLIAEYVIENPAVKVSVEGYTDSSGSYSYNISVSQFRANTIKSYLVGKGVNPSQITSVGRGPESPIASNDNEEGRRQNRRVEIKLD